MTSRKVSKEIAFLGILCAVMGLHEWIARLFGTTLAENLGWNAYLYNFLFAVIATRILLRLADHRISYLGFAFMGASLLKFVGFFVFFYPSYRLDGTMESAELISFFVPYFICLIYSSLSVFRALNRI